MSRDDEFELVNVAQAILYFLQQDARNSTTTEIGKRIGVSATTVGNRIKEMEEAGVIEGYHPEIDYSAAGFQLHLLFIGETSIGERTELAQRARDIFGVVAVQEILTGTNNLHIEAVSPEASDITTITQQLEDLGITVKETEVLGPQYIRPFNHLGADLVEED